MCVDDDGKEEEASVSRRSFSSAQLGGRNGGRKTTTSVSVTEDTLTRSSRAGGRSVGRRRVIFPFTFPFFCMRQSNTIARNVRITWKKVYRSVVGDFDARSRIKTGSIFHKRFTVDDEEQNSLLHIDWLETEKYQVEITLIDDAERK